MRKHLSKILVFFLNLLLMTVAVLVIENRDQEKKVANTENSLREENNTLKTELSSLKGALQNFELQAEQAVEPIVESKPGDSTQKIITPVPVTQNKPATNNNSTTKASSNSTVAPSNTSSQAKDPTSNAKTKTS